MKIKSLLVVPIAILAVLVGALASSAAGPRTPDQGGGASQGRTVQPMVTLPQVNDSVYHTIRPCRIVDTRSGASGFGKFNSGTQRLITVAGTTGFVPQGGTSGGCGIPLSASGITASVTTTQAQGAGYLIGWPTGTSQPNANFGHYNHDAGMTVGTNLALQGNSAAGLVIRNFGGPTHLIIDVTGFYTKVDSVLIDILGAKYYGGSTVLTSSRTSTGNYAVDFNHSLVGCALIASGWSISTPYVVTVDYIGGGSVGGGVRVHVFNAAGAPANAPFMIQATC